MTFEAARFDLARLRLAGGDALDRAMSRATEVSSRTIGVRRVGVWTFDLEHDEMRCLHLFDGMYGHSTPGTSLTLSKFEPYAEALEHRRVIVAADARADATTHCLEESYLIPKGIGAMLDAPIYRSGEVVGVVCHEHFGGPRRWTSHEVDFACSVADMLGSLAEQATRLELAAALRGHKKMEALGRLAGGVAHDFQNALSVVLLHAARIQAHPADAEIARESAELIREAADEGVRLTKRLQEFAHPRRTDPRRVSLGDVTQGLESMLRILTKGVADLEIRRETAVDEVLTDPSQLEEVVLGLVTNTLDAREEEGGAITVTVRAPTVDEPVPGALCVALEVHDQTAHAASPAPQDISGHLLKSGAFDAAGVGLSAVRNIVHRANGTMRIETSPERGTTLTVMWPLAR